MRGLLQRLAGRTGEARIAKILDRGDPVAAARWRDATSDAGKYLLGLVDWKDRISSLLELEAEVRAAIERDGRWEDYNEWRIGTVSTKRIERTGRNYRVRVDCNGVSIATVRSLPVALEASCVLDRLGKDLFWEIGWASWEGSSVEHEVRQPYLARISTQAVRDGGASKIRSTSVDWLEGTAYEAVVEEGCLSMTCVSPTAERATQFAGIFERLEADMIRLLGWC